jgi:alanine racemase
MDQCMVDVTGIDATPGDEVVLMGSQNGAAVSADELADIVGTIGYELTCGVGKRVPRVYIRNNLPVKTLRMV